MIKRNGSEVDFDKDKIYNAICKANNSVASNALDITEVQTIMAMILSEIDGFSRTVTVEEIQDIVEKNLTLHGSYDVGKAYIKYRYDRERARKANTTDGAILSIVDLSNEDIKQENSNKNPIIISTQRDYMAGEVSKDISRRLLLPPDVVAAHDEGIIHFHK